MSPSPPRLRRSPKRQALHERSHSHANEQRLSPTLRVVGDADAKVYASSPFPTEESQILAPRGRKLFDNPVSVSPSPGPPTPATIPGPTTTPTIRLIKETETGPNIPSANNGFDFGLPQSDSESSPSSLPEASSKDQASSSSIGVDRLAVDEGIDMEETDDIIQLPSVPGSRDGRGSVHALDWAIPHNRPDLRTIASVASQLSVSSAASTDTVIRSGVTGPPSRGSYAAYVPTTPPLTSAARPPRSMSTPPRLDTNRISLSPVSSTSPTSPVSPLSPIAPAHLSTERRVYSVPAYTRSNATINGDPPAVHYPRVRPPSVSAAYAQSGFTIPRKPIRMSDTAERWNSHLSTIQSEPTEDRSSYSQPSTRRGMNSNTSSMWVDESSPLSANFPFPAVPRAAALRQRDVTSSTIRVVSEEEEEEAEEDAGLSSPLSPSSGSRMMSPDSGDPKRQSRSSMSRVGAGSRGSFLRDSIPSWARYLQHNGRSQSDSQLYLERNTNSKQRSYYALDLRIQSPTSDIDDEERPGTQQSQRSQRSQRSERSVLGGLFRPRTRHRPRDIDTGPAHRDSMAITPVLEEDGREVVEVRGSPRRRNGPAWSPHLWHDRRTAAKRRTIYQAPSLDEEAEGKALSRRNAQIWLFILGWIFPPAWILAAFLPLPPRPQLTPPASPNTPNLAHDIEKALGPIDHARYENARWWRNYNRIMSVLGILLICAIIALAVVATRPH